MSTSQHTPRYHHGDLRRALIAAARAALDEGGVERISLREVARRAGVSPAAPYRHFAGRTDLIGGVAQEGFDELAAALDAAATGQDGAERLTALGRAYVRFALAQPQLFRLMFDAETGACDDPALREAAKGAYQRLVDAATTISVPSDSPLTAVSAWALVHGLSLLLLDGQLARLYPADPDTLAEAVTAQFVSGLGGRG